MRSTLDELVAELAELNALIDSIEPVNSALADHGNTTVQQYVLIRRRFDYAAYAVALYASLEKFVENLVKAFVRLETGRLHYSALPKKLTEKHLSRTAELLWRRSLGKGRYVSMNDLVAVKNLFDCLSGAMPYALNEDIVVAHDANLRAGEVDAVFSAVGIDNICDRACRADDLADWYFAAKGSPAPPTAEVMRTVIEERLKDIVERRNQVAHYGGNPDDLLGVDGMKDAVSFIESFSKSIFSLVVGRYLSTRHIASPGAIELVLRPGDGPYGGGTIVVVDRPAEKIFVRQPVFTVIETTGARWGRIQSLQVDGTDLEEVAPDTNAPQGIGIRLDFKYPKNSGAKLIALPVDDELVWIPPED